MPPVGRTQGSVRATHEWSAPIDSPVLNWWPRRSTISPLVQCQRAVPGLRFGVLDPEFDVEGSERVLLSPDRQGGEEKQQCRWESHHDRTIIRKPTGQVERLQVTLSGRTSGNGCAPPASRSSEFKLDFINLPQSDLQENPNFNIVPVWVSHRHHGCVRVGQLHVLREGRSGPNRFKPDPGSRCRVRSATTGWMAGHWPRCTSLGGWFRKRAVDLGTPKRIPCDACVGRFCVCWLPLRRRRRDRNCKAARTTGTPSPSEWARPRFGCGARHVTEFTRTGAAAPLSTAAKSAQKAPISR